MTIGNYKKFHNILNNTDKIVGFTGAGISTESGIPDYRSKGGIWNKFQPVYFNEFLQSEEKQYLYWQRKQELWEGISQAKSNDGHLFYKKLYDQNKLIGLITQNIDGLHEKSGIPSEKIVNIHGNTLETICLDCKRIIPTQEVFDTFNIDENIPHCSVCNGLLKPNTISFGQSLNQEDIQRAHTLALETDCIIVMGSTLIVQPAAEFPLLAKQNGAKLIIINLSETPLDEYADLLFQEKIGDFCRLVFD